MTILSIAVCNSTSKIIFARQFVEMTRKELEEYIVLFSRTVAQDKEVTSIETDKNRFLYYYSDQLYLVVITTKDSNVIEDMEVLKLANRLFIDICGVGKLLDTAIIEHAFELALSLDDMISFGSFENTNMLQIKSLLQMDSAEEKEFRKIQQQREKHAKEQLDIQMKQIEAKKRNKQYFNDAIGSDTIQCGSDTNTTFGNTTTFTNTGSISNNNDTNNSQSNLNAENDNTTSTSTKKVTKAKGLSLGKKKPEMFGNYFMINFLKHKFILNFNFRI